MVHATSHLVVPTDTWSWLLFLHASWCVMDVCKAVSTKGTLLRIISFSIGDAHMGMGFMQRFTLSFDCVAGSIRDAGRCYTRTLGQGRCSFSPLGKYSSLSLQRLIRPVLSAGVFSCGHYLCVTDVSHQMRAKGTFFDENRFQ